jgi:hypothetical protein
MVMAMTWCQEKMLLLLQLMMAVMKEMMIVTNPFSFSGLC